MKVPTEAQVVVMRRRAVKAAGLKLTLNGNHYMDAKGMRWGLMQFPLDAYAVQLEGALRRMLAATSELALTDEVAVAQAHALLGDGQ